MISFFFFLWAFFTFDDAMSSLSPSFVPCRVCDMSLSFLSRAQCLCERWSQPAMLF
eukprot:m.88491 g.88491  ORF g.88491 m.88491 type:complete len:56 (+) comp13627_c0_seq1:1535-1702(+)